MDGLNPSYFDLTCYIILSFDPGAWLWRFGQCSFHVCEALIEWSSLLYLVGLEYYAIPPVNLCISPGIVPEYMVLLLHPHMLKYYVKIYIYLVRRLYNTKLKP